MRLAATRIITDDVDGMVTFYERLTGASAARLHPLFAEIVTGSGTVAIASSQTAPLLANAVTAAANRSVILDFLVPDVDATYEQVCSWADVVQGPTDLPWGNRSLLVRDPDRNLVNLFAPTSDAAKERFASSSPSQE